MRHAVKLASLSRQLKGQMPLCFTPEEARRKLRIGAARMRRLVRSWQVRTVLFRGRRYVTRAEIERWQKQRR